MPAWLIFCVMLFEVSYGAYSTGRILWQCCRFLRGRLFKHSLYLVPGTLGGCFWWGSNRSWKRSQWKISCWFDDPQGTTGRCLHVNLFSRERNPISFVGNSCSVHNLSLCESYRFRVWYLLTRYVLQCFTGLLQMFVGKSAEGYSLFRGIKEGKPSVLQPDCLVDTWVGKERCTIFLTYLCLNHL